MRVNWDINFGCVLPLGKHLDPLFITNLNHLIESQLGTEYTPRVEYHLPVRVSDKQFLYLSQASSGTSCKIF